MSQDQRIFGIPLNKGVKDQLELRQKVIGDDHDDAFPNGIDSRHRMLFNSKGAWIRLTSSVNVLDEETIKYEADTKQYQYNYYYGQLASDNINNNRKALNNKTNVLARNNVLEGGVLAFNYDEDGKIKGKRRSRVDLSQSDNPYGVNSIYASTPDTGFKPMMGITELKVKSKSTYGSLKEMEINIVAHNQEQISILENLYFRPGFDMLLEFGNAAYLDKNGKVTTHTFGMSSSFLNGTAKEKILEKIEENKKESGYNYEGLLGKVINFSWDLNMDGSYDCTLKLITSGEVMESISTIKYDSKTSSARKNVSGKDPSSDLLINFFKSCKALVYSDSQKESIEKINTLSNLEVTGEYISGDISSEEAEERKKETLEKAPLTIEEVEKTYNIPKNTLKVNTFTSAFRYVKQQEYDDDGNEKTSFKTKGFTVYISLVGLAACLNRLFVDGLTDSKEKPVSTFGTNPKVSKYVTFSGNISNNPYSFGKPYDEGTGDRGPSPKQLYGGNRYGVEVDAPFECISAYSKLSQGYPTSFSMDSPYFLFVSFDYLISLQRAFLDEKKNNNDKVQSIFSFYKKVLSDVSTAFGNISKLDLHLDGKSQKWIIIDRNLYEPVTKKKDMPIINLIGKNSLVTNFSLNSKISSKLASMLSIASSSSGNGAGIEGLFKYNEGLVDRYEEVPDYSDEAAMAKAAKDNEISRNRNAAIEKISTTYAEYLKNYAVEDTFSSISSDHTFYMTHTRSLIKNDESTSTGNPRSYDGLIPIDLSFTLGGMTGFRPGEAFVVGGNVLPKRYQGLIGFVITQVEHGIGTDNRWETDIKTKMFMLPDVDTKKLLDNDSPPEKQDADNGKNNNSSIQKNLRDTYGEPGDTSVLTSVKVPIGYNLTYLGKPVKSIRIHKDIASNLENALKEIKTAYGVEKIKDYNLNIYQGSFNDRNKRNGSTKSTHSWGIALDFDADNNKLEWKRDKAEFAREEYKEFLAIFKKHGFYNLGTEKNYDYMHFQAWDPNQAE